MRCEGNLCGIVLLTIITVALVAFCTVRFIEDYSEVLRQIKVHGIEPKTHYSQYNIFAVKMALKKYKKLQKQKNNDEEEEYEDK